ncbi:MAG TPA: DUF3300 domain-containing protein [Opitutaceae bacterium]
MKRILILLAAFGACLTGRAQAPAGSDYSSDQLDQLLGPIALYPDPLVALILPASTKPDDITAAAQYVASNPDPSGIGAQPWDPSVKGLAHYPDVLQWMSQNIDWTQSLGAAFAMQPADVMKSVQSLRAKARAAGTLTDTPQQRVDMEGDDIRIVPTQDNTIYVPQYDPDDVYDVPEGEAPPEVTFDAGYPAGDWLGFELDWDDFGVYTGPWRPGWAYRRDWADPHFAGSRWHPDPRSGHALVRSYYHPGVRPPAPRLIRGARPGPVRGGAVRQAPAPARDFRGYAAPVARPSSPAPRPGVYGGYARGTQTRDYSNRGRASRAAPVRSAPAHAAPGRGAPDRGSPGRDRH